MVDLTVFWFMLPVCIGIATLAMLTGIGGTAMLTPLLILGFPLFGLPILTPAEAVGMALLTEFFGFTSGLIGYHRARLIDYNVGKKLLVVSIPTIIVFSLISQSIDPRILIAAYGIMMAILASYILITAAGNVRNRELETLPKSAERIPRKAESLVERVIHAKNGQVYKYKVCDQRRGFLITGVGAAMTGLISVGLGELEMPNLVKRCKIPIAVSAATSVFIIAITVLVGSITAIFTLAQSGGLDSIPWGLVLYTAPGAAIGGQIGAKWQGRISSHIMERVIGILFVVIAIAFLSRTVMTLI
ncbi:MAG: sulfite exporter TauE/SafE family protein [Thaumarchaeota archaeon]|nr:sulfite exporter TauE/SafE family protein [Nitrososphaerota archaeon]